MNNRQSVPRAAALAVLLAAGPGAAAAEPAYDCIIEPEVELELSTAVEGILASVDVDKGERVSEGQVLATLESGVERAAVKLARARAQMQAGLEAKRARLAHTERRAGRAGELSENQYISPEEQDEIETDRRLAALELRQERESMELARLELERARSVLDKRMIRSPIDGIVVQKYLSAGEFAKGQPILKLARIDPLRVEVVLPVSAYGVAEPGMSAQVLPEEPVGGRYQARVTLVDHVIDAASGTFGVRLELPNPDFRLPAGLSCQVRFGEGP